MTLSQRLRDLVPVFEELHPSPQGDALIQAAEKLDALAALRPTVLHPIVRYCAWYDCTQVDAPGDVAYEAVSALRQVLALLPEGGQ